MRSGKKSESIGHTMARKWKFLPAKSSIGRRKAVRHSRRDAGLSHFQERQKELMRIEQEILNQSGGVSTSSDSMAFGEKAHTPKVEFDSQLQEEARRHAPDQSEITITHHAKNTPTASQMHLHFANHNNQPQHKPTQKHPFHKTPPSKHTLPHPELPSSPPHQDPPSNEPHTHSSLLDLAQPSTKMLAVPKFKTLHPLSQIEECVDFPVELRVENYQEDPTFAKYRKRLTEELHSKLYSKKMEKLHRLDGYGTWYVPPNKWNQHMKTLKEKKQAAIESDEATSLSADQKASTSPSQHNMTTVLAAGAESTSNHRNSRSSSSKRNNPTSIQSPTRVELPVSVQVVKSHLPPLHEDKQQQLEKLHSSRRFKEYLIKTHSTIPEWLSNVPVSENVVEEARTGPLANTAIPQTLRRGNYGVQGSDQSSTKPGKNSQDSVSKMQKTSAPMEKGVAQYSGGIPIEGPKVKKEETAMQRNIADLRYISSFVKKIQNQDGKQNRKKRPFQDPLLAAATNPSNEEQHPDAASRPRRAIPLSTMLRLTSERRRKVEKDRLTSQNQSSLQYATG